MLVEKFLPGREFTVGLTGTGAGARVLGVSEIVPNSNFVGHGYGLENKEGWEDKLEVKYPTDASAVAAGEVALAAWRALNCRDGGRADIRCDAQGRPHFIEVNPLAGLRPGYSDLCFIAEAQGLSYAGPDREISQILFCAPSCALFRASRGAAPVGAGTPESLMKILVLHSDIAADAPPEERDTLVAADAVAGALSGHGHEVARAAFTKDRAALGCLVAGVEIIFNLVEGIDGLGRLAPLAPRLLDAMGVPFTGVSAEAMAMTNDKPLTKARLRRGGLATPDWSEPPDWTALDDAAWIVKSALEDASLGLDDGCVVDWVRRQSGRAAKIVREASNGGRTGSRRTLHR